MFRPNGNIVHIKVDSHQDEYPLSLLIKMVYVLPLKRPKKAKEPSGQSFSFVLAAELKHFIKSLKP